MTREMSMKTMAALSGVLALALAPVLRAQGAGTLEIRFCPAAQVRTYPLESHRDIRTLVLQNLVVINHGTEPVEVSEIDLSLMQGAEALDVKRVRGAELLKFTASGPKLQASGMLKLLEMQICDQAMIAADTKLSGPHLDPAQALLLTYQTFAFRGPRDALAVSILAKSAGQDLNANASLPIRSELSKTVFRFPLQGLWFIAVGPTPHTGHRWARMEEFAFDIARFGEGNLSHRGSGDKFSDYYAYAAPVLAAADGKVVAVVNDAAEDDGLLRKASDTDESYGERAAEAQMSLLRKGGNAAAGNYVVIDHGNGEYSLYAHLQPGSVRVKPNDAVKVGQPIAKLGSSGNSSEPHLHFQVCDGPAPMDCSGIPVNFKDLELPYADFPRPPQSGDVVMAD